LGIFFFVPNWHSVTNAGLAAEAEHITPCLALGTEQSTEDMTQRSKNREPLDTTVASYRHGKGDTTTNGLDNVPKATTN